MTPLHRPIEGNVQAGRQKFKTNRSIGDKVFKEKQPDVLTSKSDCYEYTAQDGDYLILATKGLYDVLADNSDEARYTDFMKIFLHVIGLSDEDFNALYTLSQNITMKPEEKEERGSSASSSEEELRYGLEYVEQDEYVNKIAERLVQIALSRGTEENTTVIVTSFLDNNNDEQNDVSVGSSGSVDLDGLD